VSPEPGPRLTLRQLNRALMARQLLLERSSLDVEGAIEHLVGVQAQTPLTPYMSLWTRLDGFTTDALADALLERRVARIATLRSTIHLHTASDALTIRPTVDEVGVRMLRSSRGKGLDGLHLDEVAAAARTILEDEPMTLAALAARLAPIWPDRDPEHLSTTARCVLPLVQPPPRGVWGRSGASVHTTAESFLGRAMQRADLRALVRRYLAAFGPAGVRDAQVWSGLGVKDLAPVFEELRPDLVTFSDDKGRELFDLPDAPRPPADTPAQVRFLGDLDNVWLSHADRDRMVDPGHRSRLIRSIGPNKGTVLLDGRLQGMWRTRSTKSGVILGIEPFGRLAKTDQQALEREGRTLLSLLAPARFETAEIRFDGLA
jgi:hypothetical protein